MTTVLMWAEQNQAVTMLFILMWVLPWKGWALWLAARRGERGWFIAFLLVHTLAILEIIYIFMIAKRSDVPKKNTNPTI